METENSDLYKEFLTVAEVAEYLGVHENSVYKYLKEGGRSLPSIRISKRKILVKKSDLVDWLEDQRKENNAKKEKQSS